MAHRSSASALRAARAVLEKYTLVVRPPETLVSGRVPNLEANEAHVSVLIDYATNLFHVALLRPELTYWQTALFHGCFTNDTNLAAQVAGYLQRLVDALLLVPQDDNKIVMTSPLPIQWGGARGAFLLTKAAREGARFLLHYYEVSPIGRSIDLQTEPHRLAAVIEAALGAPRILEMLPIAQHCLQQLKSGAASKKDVIRALRLIGILFQYLPCYDQDREDEVKLLV